MRYRIPILLSLCLLVFIGTLATAHAMVLENPQPGSTKSGIGLISGWACDAEEITISIDEAGPETHLFVPYGSAREDTRKDCGDIDNGFGLTYNYSELGDGPHTLSLFIDGERVSVVTFHVLTLGTNFLRNVEGTGTIMLSDGRRVTVTWEESTQNFAITDYHPSPPRADVPRLVFGDQMSDAARQRVRTLLSRAMYYMEEETGVWVSEFTAYVFMDLEQFLDAFVRQTRAERRTVREWIRERGDNLATAEFTNRGGTGRDVFLYGDFWFASDARLLRVLAHEYFHIIQFAGLTATERAAGTGPETYATGPSWLAEGSATYAEVFTTAWAGLFEYGEQDVASMRAWRIAEARTITTPLPELETREGLFNRNNESARWWLAFTAVDFLVENFGGLQALITYYQEVTPGIHWKRTFRAAFGVSVETFYAQFADYQRSGFPLATGE